MTLTKTDYENIELIINTVNIILNNFNNLAELETNNKLDNNKIDTILKELERLEEIENNLLIDLTKDENKIDLIMNTIEKININPIIKNRIIIKLNKLLDKIIYNKIKMTNKLNIIFNSELEKIQFIFEKNNIFNNELNQALINDIFNLARFYLNKMIKNNTNSFIKKQLIEFKYNDMFLGLNSSKEIIDYINVSDVTLSFDFVYEFIQTINNSNQNETEKEIIKSIFIKNKINDYSLELLNIKNEEITNDEITVKAIILKSYIKACSNLLNDNEFKEKFIASLNSSNKISKFFIIDALNETDKPKIYNVKLKIK